MPRKPRDYDGIITAAYFLAALVVIAMLVIATFAYRPTLMAHVTIRQQINPRLFVPSYDAWRYLVSA